MLHKNKKIDFRDYLIIYYLDIFKYEFIEGFVWTAKLRYKKESTNKYRNLTNTTLNENKEFISYGNLNLTKTQMDYIQI